MEVELAHVRIGGASVAIFNADARGGMNHDRHRILAELVAHARLNHLRVDRAALAFVRNGRLTFFGDRDLVHYLSRIGVVPQWTHRLRL